jgi:hypothetical protein
MKITRSWPHNSRRVRFSGACRRAGRETWPGGQGQQGREQGVATGSLIRVPSANGTLIRLGLRAFKRLLVPEACLRAHAGGVQARN